ncbi:hypothetical protein EDD86DRAFT_277969 [Gorgonomyces haynaldii]|nr:hypothetical protein EDD86DRAFT_277969 [Gorgonomyces haynaldii]
MTTSVGKQSKFKRDFKRQVETSDQLFETVGNVVEREIVDDNMDFVVHPSGFPQPSKFKKEVKKKPVAVVDPVIMDIHNENVRKIQSMTVDEIESARQEIEGLLDPSTIAFLAKRAKNQSMVPNLVTSQVQPGTVQPSVDPALFNSSPDVSIPKESPSSLHTANLKSEQVKQETVKQEIERPEIRELENAEHLDLEKIEWMVSKSKDSQEDRFDFDANLLDPKTEVPSYHGLYHHGDSPDAPGYTISELVHLSRSTFPTQRSIVLKTLLKLVQRIHRDYPQTYMDQLIENDFLLSLRIALDATHDTVVLDALDTLSALVFSPEYHQLQTLYLLEQSRFYSFDVLQSIGQQHELQQRPESIESIRLVLKRDFVLGLVSTNLLVRLRYLLDTKPVPLESKRSVVRILIAISQHSVSLCEDILETSGLVDALHTEIQHLGWPCSSAFLEELLLLYKYLCAGSKRACESFVRHGLIGYLMRYLAIPGSETISVTVLQTLEIVFGYRLGASLLDEYRLVLFSLAKFMITNHQGLGLASLFRMSKMALESFSALDCGGPNDGLFPIVQQSVDYLNSGITGAAALSLLQAYFNQVFVYQVDPTTKSLELLSNVIQRLRSFDYKILTTIHVPSAVKKERVAGLMHANSIRDAQQLLESTVSYLVVSQFSSLLHTLVSRNKIGSDMLLALSEYIEQHLDFANVSDWIQIYGHGRVQLLNQHLINCSHLKRMSVSRCYQLISLLLPGDDFIGSRVFHGQIAKNLSPLLRDLYGSVLFSRECIKHSQQLMNILDGLSSRMVEDQSMYPVRSNWILEPYQYLYKLSQSDDIPNLDIMLEELLTLSQHLLVKKQDLMMSVMQVFLMSDVYRQEKISRLLDQVYQTNGDVYFEDDKFYELYQALVDRFIADSYGDPVFSKYLLLGLDNRYPHDFRHYFWVTLGPLVKAIQWQPSDLPLGSIDRYLPPKNDPLAPIYKQAIKRGYIHSPYVLKIDKSQSFCKKCFKKLCNLDFSVHEVVLGPKEAKTIVFVHGGGGCRNMFAHHARLLSKDYRCVLVDLPGHGTRMEEPLSLQTAIQVIVDTTRKHASPNHPKIYVGGSLGGYIGMELLGQHPKLFDAAVITMCGQAVGKQNRGYAAYFGLLMMDTFASLFSQKMLFDSMIQQAQQNGHISEQLLEEMVYKSGFYFGQAKEQIQILKDSNPVPSLFKFDGRVMFVNGSKDHRDSEQLWLKTCKKGELHSR